MVVRQRPLRERAESTRASTCSAYACLVAIMVRGHGAHTTAEERLAEVAAANRGPAPVVSSAGALIDAIRALGLRRVAIITPYLPELTQAVAAYIEDYGITVTEAVALSVADNVEVANIPQERLVEEARGLDMSTADGVVLSCCVQMPSLSAIAPVEAELGARASRPRRRRCTACCGCWDARRSSPARAGSSPASPRA